MRRILARMIGAEEAREQDARAAWRAIADLLLAPEAHERFQAATAAASLPHPGVLRLLLALRGGDPPSMSGLAGFMSCDASYATALVDVLENAGYVERRTSSTDRRVKHVHLTPAGVAAREAALHVLATPPETIRRLTATEVRTLARLLGKLVEADGPTASRGDGPAA